MSEPKRRLYLDLDGVMADFDAHFPATFGLDHRGMADDEMWKSINAHPSYFRDMPPCAGAIEFFRSIEHLRPIILTACPRTNYQHVARQKRVWVREHLSEHVTVLPVMGGRNKPLFMQEAGDVLIDDWSKNTEAWEQADGVAILHRDFASTAAALSDLFPAVEPDVGVRAADERAAICWELGCIDKPGVPLSFIQDLRSRLAKANRRNGDLIRSWDPATPTERQELDRMRRGWGPSSPTERERRRLDVASCLSALSTAMTNLSVGEDEEVPEEAQDRLDLAYERVRQQYTQVAETLRALVADPQVWPDIDAAEERGAMRASGGTHAQQRPADVVGLPPIWQVEVCIPGLSINLFLASADQPSHEQIARAWNERGGAGDLKPRGWDGPLRDAYPGIAKLERVDVAVLTTSPADQPAEGV